MNEEKKKKKTPGRLECTEPAWGKAESRGFAARRQPGLHCCTFLCYYSYILQVISDFKGDWACITLFVCLPRQVWDKQPVTIVTSLYPNTAAENQFIVMICTSDDVIITEKGNTGKPNPECNTSLTDGAQLLPGHLIWWTEGAFVQDGSPFCCCVRHRLVHCHRYPSSSSEDIQGTLDMAWLEQHSCLSSKYEGSPGG